mmetsp:Transcript_78096/g.126644  ORF Transcript_78096/g.126644 Transcript_78096/m.126644 type:complete len:239 (+) Transcript_78096:232-948(+)
MRSDDRFYFLLAAFVMTSSLIYTVFFHVLPELDQRHNYLYAHCTVTGDGHWEKYETVYGIKERVVVPVEVRIGTIEGALDWDGVDPLNSTDVYHQGIGRDKPSGWEYFTKEEKKNYLKTYKPGQAYECWMRPGPGTNEVVFHKKAITFRLIPELIFCAIVLFLCIATGVCMGMLDILRSMIGLPATDQDEDEQEDMPGVATDKYGDYGSVVIGSGSNVIYRQFSAGGYGDKDGDREWV